MALETLSKQMFNFYAPVFEVEIENQPMTRINAKAVMDVTVDEKLDEGASFRLTIHDEFDMTTGKFKWLDHQLFTVGNRVAVKMGYSSNLTPMVEGRITSLEPSFFSGETPTLTVGGQDLSYDYVKRTTPERTFVNKTYSDMARTIAEEAGMDAVVDDTGSPDPFVRKDNNETYYRFLQRIARRVGYTFSIDRKTMYFIKPKDDEKEILTLELGKDIISFHPNINTAQTVSEVEVRGHNPGDPNTPLVGIARAGSERSQEPGRTTASQIVQTGNRSVRKVVSNVSVTSVEHANAVALSLLNEANDTLITGDGECIGIPQIRPGVAIRLNGMGERFSGKYYVKGTTHTIGSSGYRTRFSVKRNAL